MTPFDSRTADAGEAPAPGAPMAGEVDGPEDAPGIVLVHGTRMAGAYWHAQVVALRDRFRVIALDLPGHGALRDVPFTHQRAVDAIREAAQQCAGGAAILVGHSLGGFLAMDVATAAPGCCRGLVLVGCSARADGPATWPYRLALPLLARLPADRLTRWNDRLLRRMYAAELVEPQIAAGYGFAAIPAAWGSVLGRDHARALARSYRGPILVLNGGRDPLSRLGERRFLRVCAGSELRVLRGASHLCNLDRPAEFAAAVRGFAERVSGVVTSR